MISLGIETSCDETSVCTLRDRTVLSLKTFSQVDLHSVYGGVVPEIASRDHLLKISKITSSCLADSDLSIDDIDVICYTGYPGLAGSLIVGKMFALGLSVSANKETLEVDHRVGHIFTCYITHGIRENFMCLLMSGGHTALYDVQNIDSYQVVGRSVDDSIGEVYDKISKALGLGYPGGLIIERLARYGDVHTHKFTSPFLGKDLHNFSLSGLKTQCLKVIQGIFCHDDLSCNQLRDLDAALSGDLSSFTVSVANLCASFQFAILQMIRSRLKNAINARHNVRFLVLCGGVSSNEYLRGGILMFCRDHGVEMAVPDKHLCTDNAAMIANIWGVLTSSP